MKIFKPLPNPISRSINRKILLSRSQRLRQKNRMSLWKPQLLSKIKTRMENSRTRHNLSWGKTESYRICRLQISLRMVVKRPEILHRVLASMGSRRFPYIKELSIPWDRLCSEQGKRGRWISEMSEGRAWIKWGSHKRLNISFPIKFVSTSKWGSLKKTWIAIWGKNSFLLKRIYFKAIWELNETLDYLLKWTLKANWALTQLSGKSESKDGL